MARRYSLVSYLSVLSLGYLSTGLLIPAMGLLLDSKGYSLFYLGVAMFCYSGTVLVFEVPSGLFCDAKGRRNSYVFGLFFLLIGTLCLFSQSLAIVLLGFSLSGLGRAFGSGSLDALFIEHHLSANRKLEDVMVALDIASSLFLALGSFLGGFLLARGKTGVHLCDLLLSVRFVLIALHICLVFLLISNDTMPRQKRIGLHQQATLLLGQIKENPFLAYFVLYTGIEGMLLASMESYWQPFLKGLLADQDQIWLLGFIGGMVFLVSIVGSLMGKVLLKGIKASFLFLLFLLLAFVGEFFLALAHSPLLFCILYAGIYLLLGIVSVVGGVLLNKALDSSIRSSALSLNSLFLQVGGLFATLVALPVLKSGSIVMYWILVASFGFLVTTLLGKPFSKAAPRS
ncbi:MFS transporter [uncultured Sphaerochaeta sp.]|uniref:MFS transporter n=1 Tax=uncultured Sphaerochaeta sp. TaxID=886478 RepID=UPI002A0A5FBF|nr:MFS transporter [uncultured Sphaerochaeta sp.]